jgi:segregation and condensation protein A
MSAPEAQGPAPLAEIDLYKLLDAFQTILKRVQGRVALEVSAERITIHERMTQLSDFLRLKRSCMFEELFEGVRSRYEVVVTFLALLEMTKLRMTRIYQADPKSALHVHYALLDADSPTIPPDEELEPPQHDVFAQAELEAAHADQLVEAELEAAQALVLAEAELLAETQALDRESAAADLSEMADDAGGLEPEPVQLAGADDADRPMQDVESAPVAGAEAESAESAPEPDPPAAVEEERSEAQIDDNPAPAPTENQADDLDASDTDEWKP